ncbi:MAG: hypothetical protein J5859_04020 [Clostridia bacterium]|nr:hypothetical protein [Clostridia bacterium]
MEFVFVILAIIWFVVKNAAKKEKSGAGKKPGAAVPSAASGTRMTPEAVEARKAEIREKLRSLQSIQQAVSTPAAPAPAAAPSIHAAAAPSAAAEPQESLEGFSYTDEYGCVGGSMPHTSETEGMSYADEEGCVGGSMVHGHTEEVKKQSAARRQEGKDMGTSAARGRLNASDMRRAIVMSEILSRPVAMR